MNEVKRIVDGQLADLLAVEWYADSYIEACYVGPFKEEIVEMNSMYRCAFRSLLNYIYERPWLTVMKASIEFREKHQKGYETAEKYSFNKKMHSACKDAADQIIDYLNAGLPE